MSATRPITSQPLYETPNNETDATDPNQESQLPPDVEPMNAEGVR